MVTKNEVFKLVEQLDIVPNLTNFDDRIKFQKLVYLMQEGFGIDLDFEFTWYIHGPYSPDLTKLVFNNDPGYQTKIVENSHTIKSIKKMGEFLKNEDLSRHNLELLGSLHYVLSAGGERNHKESLKLFSELKPQFSTNAIKKAYEKIKQFL
ncbi:MAG: hypothetical protein IH841_08050 [Thaumarchaeota archaeon]|nr:hypothetical protein [Nitrososphaerota archaeon]